jgi:hypothetical protein
MDVLGAFMGFFVFFFIYLIPAIVAHQRGHHQHMAILVLTMFFGWTLIGWGIALVWSCTAIPPPSVATSQLALPQ